MYGYDGEQQVTLCMYYDRSVSAEQWQTLLKADLQTLPISVGFALGLLQHALWKIQPY